MRFPTTIGTLAVALTALHAQEVGWPANGRDVEGTRYLAASDISRENISRLEVAWTYRTGETDPRFATSKETAFEATLSWWTARCTSARRSAE